MKIKETLVLANRLQAEAESHTANARRVTGDLIEAEVQLASMKLLQSQALRHRVATAIVIRRLGKNHNLDTMQRDFTRDLAEEGLTADDLRAVLKEITGLLDPT